LELEREVKKQYSRGDRDIPCIPERIRGLKKAEELVEKFFREQRFKDNTLCHIYNEIQELEELVNN